ncbi:MAG: hypothetical protein AB8G15_09825 [Saprospiraceae bacterium]
MMIRIPLSLSKRLFFGIAGVFFTAIGMKLFPSAVLLGFFELIPLVIASGLMLSGVWAIYMALLYEVKIEASGLTIRGRRFLVNKIPKETIRGYFLTQKMVDDEYDEVANYLILVLTDGRYVEFDDLTLGTNLEVLKKEISSRYSRLPAVEKVNYQLGEKKFNKKILHVFTLCLFLFGAFLTWSIFHHEVPLVQLEGRMVEQPFFEYDRHTTPTRIHLNLAEYPEISFSQVKEISSFVAWAKADLVGQKVQVGVTEKEYKSKIKRTIPPDKVILNYDLELVEIKTLHQGDFPVYVANLKEDYTIGIVIMLLAMGVFFYYRNQD